MINFSITKEQLSDLLNLHHQVFYPLKHFVNYKQFKSILFSKKIDDKFFPLPIFFGIDKTNFNKIKKQKFLKLFYKRNFLSLIKIKDIFQVDSNIVGEKIFGKNFKKHPYFIKHIKKNFAYLDFKYEKLNKQNLKHKNILIQPLIGQYKKNEYLDKVIIKSNKLVAKMYGKNKAFYAPYFSYPRYGGPLESALHAIVRKNYGCSHFWVGRDHAGYKNFYEKYTSQNFCKKNETKLGIKIIAQSEPYFCVNCKKIVNKKCLKKSCKNSKKMMISGTKIRSLINKNKKIPEYLMHKKISQLLNNKSILKH
jgi:sulfate adenylyltransferase